MRRKKLALFLICIFALRGTSRAGELTAGESALLYDSYAAEAKGDLDAAISRMTILLGSRPDDYLVNYRLGWLFSVAKKNKNSIDHYERAAESAPKSLEPWLALASLYLSLGDGRRAGEAALQLLKRDPKNYYGLQRLAAARMKLKDDAGALRAVDQGLALYPLDVQFLEKKGTLLKQLGRKEESRDTLETVLLLSPQDAYAKSELKR